MNLHHRPPQRRPHSSSHVSSERERSSSSSSSGSSPRTRSPPITSRMHHAASPTPLLKHQRSPSPQLVLRQPHSSRRPLSPLSLRDIDVDFDDEDREGRDGASVNSRASGGASRVPPLSGHDLMALFPPASPAASFASPATAGSEVGVASGTAGTHSTSGFFEKQERAFFSRADALQPLPHQERHRRSSNAISFAPYNSSALSPTQRTSPPSHSHSLLRAHSSYQLSPPTRGASTGPATSPLGPGSFQLDGPASTSTPSAPALRSRTQPHFQRHQGYQQLSLPPPPLMPSPAPRHLRQEDGPTASPPEPRRRAGKHTKRVIVRS